MIIAVHHSCGHTANHVTYGSATSLARQHKNLATTQCPDCFHEKVVRLIASHAALKKMSGAGPGDR